ncbi:protein of unknown function [Stenotrophomonas maltophilia]|nr:protein of unknown function [Stenotrophomonas maltophilia]
MFHPVRSGAATDHGQPMATGLYAHSRGCGNAVLRPVVGTKKTGRPEPSRRNPRWGARLQRGVLQLLQRTHLQLGGGRLGSEPLLFLGERVDALALRLGRHIDGGDLQQARQGERASALLVHRGGDGAFQRGQHSADVLGDDAGGFSDVCNQAGLGQHFLDRLRSGRLGGCLRRDFLHCLLRGSLLSGLCHGFLFRERLVVWSAPNPVGKRNVGQLSGAANSPKRGKCMFFHIQADSVHGRQWGMGVWQRTRWPAPAHRRNARNH